MDHKWRLKKRNYPDAVEMKDEPPDEFADQMDSEPESK